MLMISRLEKPADTITQNWCVQCKRPDSLAKAEDVVTDIIRYATYPVGAYREIGDTGTREYLIEFECTDGFLLQPTFYTAEALLVLVQKILKQHVESDDTE
jgi:hypothetical protein